MLTELDGLQNLKNVVVLAATNRPDMLDPALLRPGRFDKVIQLPAPDEKMRLEIFNIHTKGMPLAKDVDLKELAKKSEGYTGADIEGLCREAGMFAIRSNSEDVKASHFSEALGQVRPSITKNQLERMKKFVGKEDTMYR
jgi:transitional endoplasmic reticulum ATPase